MRGRCLNVAVIDTIHQEHIQNGQRRRSLTCVCVCISVFYLGYSITLVINARFFRPGRPGRPGRVISNAPLIERVAHAVLVGAHAAHIKWDYLIVAICRNWA